MHFRVIQTILRYRCVHNPTEYRVPSSNHKANSQITPGVLSVVATPIGNFADISERALHTLRNVDLVLAEDTRHSRILFNQFGINTRLKACHEHNEAELVEWVVSQLEQGRNLALISDAGTPLISDPGFVLIRALREQGCRVEVVPGASAIIAALSVAGLPTDRFLFDGFLPAKRSGRQSALQGYVREPRTVVLLESTHRIEACLEDVQTVFGADKHIVLARELTKKFETVLGGRAEDVRNTLLSDPNQQRGEFVLLLAGAELADESQSNEIELHRCLAILLEELPLKQAAALAAKLCNVKKNQAYRAALEIHNGSD